ncbi:MAG: ComEC/Rec2 family competence protein [Acidimicrobiia bacterium]|nr:ComEC/Rec2 family competence protein [Acidimicrobiia bacterium]
MKAPLALVAALATGVLLGDALGPGSARTLLLGAIVGIGLGFRWRATAWGLAVATVAMLLLGIAVEQRAAHGLVVSPLATATEQRARGEAVLVLTEDPDGPQFQTEAVARVESFRSRDAGGRRVLATATGDVKSGLGVLDAGDRLRVSGSFEPLHGYSTRLRWRHVVAEFHVDDVIAIARPDSPWYLIANQARDVVTRGSRVLPSTPRALLSGFLLGDTRAIPDDLVNDFRDAGLSHLLAVSGANVAFALAIAEPALRRLRRGPRFVVGIGVIALFGTMTRWEPSVLRASVMAGLVMLARAIGRPADAARVLVVAVTALLVADPFLLHSVGFLLSCGACAGIVVGSRAITGWLRGPGWFCEALGVTTAAQIGVAPVILTTFGTLPLVALPANLLAAPFVGPLTVWGLVASVVGALLGRSAALWLQLPTLTMLRSVEVIARTAATVPLEVDGRTTLVGSILFVVGYVFNRARRVHPGRLRIRGRRVHREGKRPGPAQSGTVHPP